MHFEEMNALAVRKILKKFDKRTSLGASKAYRLNNGKTTSGPLARSIAKDMCAEIQLQDLRSDMYGIYDIVSRTYVVDL